MRVLLINSVCGIRSTGRICTDIADEYSAKGDEVKIAYGREAFVPEEYQKYAVRIGNSLDLRLHALESRIFDDSGFGSRIATKKFLKWADEFNPDILWLHNIHGYYINVPLLFEWIKRRPQMQVKWTLHDCWPLTGHCYNFEAVDCEKWKTHCNNCPQKNFYPKSLVFDNSKRNYKKKQNMFCGVNNLSIITPSQWLSNIVRESYLKDYPVEVIHNTIDTEIFKPTESSFRSEHNLVDKKIVLGVQSAWDNTKGLDDYISLSKRLPNTYKVVLVGVTKEQIEKIPNQILCIERTNSKEELARIYSAADVFLNLTYQDNYPTVNLEAQACGTPCITYRTGGSPESVPKENVVEKGDIDALIEKLESNSYESACYRC